MKWKVPLLNVAIIFCLYNIYNVTLCCLYMG